jgi:hypothetical protein
VLSGDAGSTVSRVLALVVRAVVRTRFVEHFRNGSHLDALRRHRREHALRRSTIRRRRRIVDRDHGARLHVVGRGDGFLDRAAGDT